MVQWDQRLVHIEADDAEDAVQGSIEALRGLGDWPEDPDALSAHPYVEHHKHRRARGLHARRHRPAPAGRKHPQERMTGRHLAPAPPPPDPRLTSPRHERRIEPWNRSPRHGYEGPRSAPSHADTPSGPSCSALARAGPPGR